MTRLLAIFFTLVFSLPGTLLAHHPTGGKIPTTFFDGFLSGLAHPIIGADHLIFMVALGFCSFLVGRKLVLPLFFVAATLLGCFFHLQSFDFPYIEHSVSFSIIIFGLLIYFKDLRKNFFLIPLTLASGILHGYAYGESIVGAEASPLGAYLLGFGGIQLMLAVSISLLSQKASWISAHSKKIGLAASIAGASLFYLIVAG